jgi:hypothetical protein
MLISGLSMLVMVAASLMGGNQDLNNMFPGWLISTYFVITIGIVIPLCPDGAALPESSQTGGGGGLKHCNPGTLPWLRAYNDPLEFDETGCVIKTGIGNFLK